jgi:hypothetical protein
MKDEHEKDMKSGCIKDNIRLAYFTSFFYNQDKGGVL